MCPGAKNIKTVADAHATDDNEYGDAKHEIETPRSRNRRKLVRAPEA
jgi:hypothetical protein